MKNGKMALCVVLVLLLSSCSSTRFFQVYDVASSSKSNMVEVNVSEKQNDDCIISYDFWDEGGDVGFNFYNKTDKNIYIHLDECFFVMNGIAQDYYKNRVYSRSRGAGLATIGKLKTIYTSSAAVSSSASTFEISKAEKRIICIPSKTSKYINEYKVTGSPFRDCNLLRFPKRKDVEKLVFSFEDSPFVFSNRLCYSVGKNEELKQVDNEFFISSIQNMTSDNIVLEKVKEFCGEKRELTKIKIIKRGTHSQFYIEYVRKENAFKH